MKLNRNMIRLVLCALLLTACHNEPKSDPNVSLVDYCVSAFPVGMSLYTAGNRQYVAYYDSLHQMTVAMRNLPDGPWAYQKLDEKVPWDAHNSVTMCMDKRGVMHVVGNMHASPLNYFRTDTTGNIATLHRVDGMVGTQEKRTTYPHFMRLPDGRILFHYRDGGSGNGSEVYNILNEDGTWSRFLDKPLTDGRGLMNAYMQGPIVGPDGLFHLIWVWRDTPDCSTNHDLSYACSPDLKHWKSADGTDIPLPITSLYPSLIVDPAQPGEGMINGGQRLGFDSQNRPVIAFHKYDAQGNIQIYITRFQDNAWKQQCLTDWNYRWEFKGNGAISFELTMGGVTRHEDKTLHVSYSRFDFKTGDHWSKVLVVDEETLTLKEEIEKPRSYPEWIDTLECPFAPDMAVRTARSGGDGGYLLRWESLPANRDKKPDRELPPPSTLKVIKL